MVGPRPDEAGLQAYSVRELLDGLLYPAYCVNIYRKAAYDGYDMDNLTLRRWLAFAGIATVTAGIIGIMYGIFNNNYIIQLLGLACIVVAYLISVQVRRLRQAYEARKKE